MIYNLKNLSNKKNFILYISLIPILIWLAIFASDLIHQPFIWDDLHFFRNYSLGELKSTWTGNWDPDNIETPSYRPIAVIYYHLLYTIFGENTFFLRIFVFLKAFILLFLLNSILNFLRFKKEEILIFSFLITFSKIFSTLIAWFTISLLLVVYIFSLLSIYFFMKSIEENKISFYLLSFFLAFLVIFMREELYVLPGILLLIFFFKNKINLKNFLKCFSNIIPYLTLVVLHIFLRKNFVPEAEHFGISNFTIFFGDNPLGFGGLIKTIKSSFLPMGYLSSNYSDLYQVYFSSAWITLILTSSFLICLKLKFESKNLKKIYILFILILCCSLPHITIARSFGIFLPTVFALCIISILINSVLSMSLNFRFFKYFAVLVFVIGVSGGIYRSNLHIKSMNVFAKDIVFYDTQFIYGYKDEGKIISIPLKRYKDKKIHLQSLNINQFDKDPTKISSSSKKILKTKYHPLWF